MRAVVKMSWVGVWAEVSAVVHRATVGRMPVSEAVARIADVVAHLWPDARVLILACLPSQDVCEVWGAGGFSDADTEIRERVQACAHALVRGEEGERRLAGYRVLGFPLAGMDRTVGALCVAVPQAVPFPDEDRQALTALAAQVATLLLHARWEKETRQHLDRKADELNRLRRAGLLISSRLRLQDTLEAILQMALEVTDARYGVLRLVDESGTQLITHAFAGEQLRRPAVESLPLDESSITGWVALHRESLCIADVRQPPWSRIYYPLDHDLEMRSELAVPLVGANGRLEGVVNLESPRVAAFSEEDKHLLQALATQAVIAIQEARLLDALQDLTRLLLTERTDVVFERLAHLAGDLLDAAGCAIWLREGKDLVLRAATPDQRIGERIPVDRSLAGEAVRRGEPVISNDVQTDPRFFRSSLARTHRWTTALVVPMLVGNSREAVGAFSVYWQAERTAAESPVSDWDKKVLTLLAHYAALAVWNARRQEDLRRAQAQRAVAETFAALGDIAANVLHHLNNKVGTIPVRVQGIEDKCQDLVERSPYLAANLREIEHSAREAMEAVRDSLTLLRPIQRVPVNVRRCIEDALQSVHIPKDVTVHVHNVDSLPPVMASRYSLTLVFVNLFQNAVEAMQGRGDLFVEGHLGKDAVEIHVRDTGPGIPPELHSRIFELDFSQARRDQKHRLGFGLWWVKTLLARIGGSVQVHSVPQTGTTFVLKLPVEER